LAQVPFLQVSSGLYASQLQPSQTTRGEYCCVMTERSVEFTDQGRKERLGAWLDTARCRLPSQEYLENRAALVALRKAIDTQDAAATSQSAGCSNRATAVSQAVRQVCEVLWKAEFPEGTRAHALWISSLHKCFPSWLQDQFKENVRISAPAPLSPPGIPSEELPQFWLGGEQPVALTDADATQAAVAPVASSATSEACSSRRVERGWLIERSEAFLGRPCTEDKVTTPVGQVLPSDASFASASARKRGVNEELRPAREAAKSQKKTSRSKATVQATDLGALFGSTVISEAPVNPPPPLLCAMCREHPLEPKVSAMCGHFGCGDCWDKWMIIKFECPICRRKTRPQNLITLKAWGN